MEYVIETGNVNGVPMYYQRDAKDFGREVTRDKFCAKRMSRKQAEAILAKWRSYGCQHGACIVALTEPAKATGV